MGITVFIAEDEPVIRIDLKELLESEGYDVIGEASDGFDAVEGCRKLNPDIVLMDIKMPMLNGINAAEILMKEGFEGCIIMLTAYSDEKFIVESNKNGVMGYFTKPIDERHFLNNLKIMHSRREEFKKTNLEIVKLKNKLEERKKIEKAKGILMEERQITENEAYEYIRTISMSKRLSLLKMAEIIIMSKGMNVYD